MSSIVSVRDIYSWIKKQDRQISIREIRKKFGEKNISTKLNSLRKNDLIIYEDEKQFVRAV